MVLMLYSVCCPRGVINDYETGAVASLDLEVGLNLVWAKMH